MSVTRTDLTNFTRLERSYDAAPEAIWTAWTTAEGIASWWAPDGFTVTVSALDLREGGELVYAMEATGEGQIAFMHEHGLPLVNEATKRFTEITEPARLAYQSVVDFVPGRDAFEILTIVDLAAAGTGTDVTMRVEPMPDAEWTERLIAGRTNELENLAVVLGG